MWEVKRARSPVGTPTRSCLQRRIVTKSLMVVEILVAEGDRDDPLGEHFFLVVDDEPGISRVRNCLVEGLEQTDPLADFAQDRAPASDVNRPPRKSATTDLEPMLESTTGSRLQSVIAVAFLEWV